MEVVFTASSNDVGNIVSPVTVTEGNISLDIAIPTVGDDVDEGNETFSVTISAAGWEEAAQGQGTTTVTIADDDTAGVTITAANPLNVSEGATATYTVVLNSQPTADVTVAATSGDVDAASVSPLSYTFTSSTWNTAQSFTITGVADSDTNDESVGISHSVTSTDTKYANALVGTVSVSVTDTTTPPPQQQNRAPTVANAISDTTIVNQSGTRQVSLSGVFADADSDTLTVTAASSNTAKATVSVAADYSSLTVTARSRGTATITVTADDGNGGTVQDTFIGDGESRAGGGLGHQRRSRPGGGFDAGCVPERRVQRRRQRRPDHHGDILEYRQSHGFGGRRRLQAHPCRGGPGHGDRHGHRPGQRRQPGQRPVQRNGGPPRSRQQQLNQPPTVASAIGDATIVNESGTHQVSLSGDVQRRRQRQPDRHRVFLGYGQGHGVRRRPTTPA